MAPGNTVQQGGTRMQGHLVSPGPLQNSIQQQQSVQPQSQQQTLLREENTALTQVRKTKSFFHQHIPLSNTLMCFIFCSIMFPVFYRCCQFSRSVYFSPSGQLSLCSLSKVHCLHLTTTQWWSLSKVLLMWSRLPPVWLRILGPTLLLLLHLHKTVQLRLGLHHRHYIVMATQNPSHNCIC